MPVHTNLYLRDGDGLRLEGAVLDLSRTGCRIELKRGQRVVKGRSYALRMAGIDCDIGSVVWSAQDKAGLQFHQPLYEPVMEDIVRRFPPLSATAN